MTEQSMNKPIGTAGRGSRARAGYLRMAGHPLVLVTVGVVVLIVLIVAYGGRIDLWFDPADHVPWTRQAMQSGNYDLALVDGYLPAVRYRYRRPASGDSCEMAR